MDLIKLNINLEDMDEYEPLPASLYTAEVRDVEIKFSEKVPGGYLYIQFCIHPSDFPADYDPANAPEGLNIVYARTQIPDGLNRRLVRPYKELLKALSIPAQGNEFNPADWIGKQAQVLLSVNEYQGAPVNNVDAVKGLPAV